MDEVVVDINIDVNTPIQVNRNTTNALAIASAHFSIVS